MSLVRDVYGYALSLHDLVMYRNGDHREYGVVCEPTVAGFEIAVLPYLENTDTGVGYFTHDVFLDTFTKFVYAISPTQAPEKVQAAYKAFIKAPL